MSKIYFDNAATTPIAESVQQAMIETMQNCHGNPSSIHAEGRKARTTIERARKIVADHINASLGEVFFTSCGTEANNMVLKNAIKDHGVKRIITSPTEHHAITHTVDVIKKEYGDDIIIEWVALEEYGKPSMTDLAQKLAQSNVKTLVSLMHSNNETGTMIDLYKVGEICREHHALFHSDTVQSIGFYPIDVQAINIHFLNGSAHKFYGPKGIGFVYINNDNILSPYIHGGGQERNMRSGTENIIGIQGLATSLKNMEETLDERKTHILELKNYFIEQLNTRFTDLRYNSHPTESNYKILNVAFPPSEKAELLLFNLDIAGICCSGGSACSSGANAGSHVLRAIHGEDDNWASIRFSFSHYNTKEEIDIVISKLEKILTIN